MISAPRSLDAIDLTDLDNFANGFPHDPFAIHRREAPVWWHDPTENTPDGEGFWSVATHAETLEVLRNPEIYSSERGGNRRHGGTLIQDLPVAGRVLNMMDDPRHARVRALVSHGLTPRMIRRVEDDARQRIRGLLDSLEDGSPLPMQMICLQLGVPAGRRGAAAALFPLPRGRARGVDAQQPPHRDPPHDRGAPAAEGDLTRGPCPREEEARGMAIGLTLKFEIKPGTSEQFEAGFRKAAAAVKAEDEGCEMYDLFRSIDSPTTYVMVERWTTQALLDAHMKSPTMAGMAALAPHFAGAPSMVKYEVG